MKKTRIIFLCTTIIVMTVLTGCGNEKSNPLTIGKQSGDYAHPKYSPDGKHIAYTLQDKLYVVDSSGNHKQRITGSLFGPIADVNAISWISKDEIVYAIDKSKDFIANSSLISYNILTHKKRVIKNDLNMIYDLSRNPIHKYLLAIVMNVSNDISSPGEHYIYLLNLSNGKLTQVINAFKAEQVFWYPDGESLLTATDHKFIKNNINTLKSITIEQNPAVESIGICNNANKILYRILGIGSYENRSGMYILGLNFHEKPKKLVDIDMVDYDCSPDGKTIVYTTVGGIGYNELKLYHLK